MPGTRSNAPEVRESIEAKGSGDDVEMEDRADEQDPDADGDDDADADADPDPDADADGEVDADGEPNDEEHLQARIDSGDILEVIQTLATYLSNYQEDGEELASGFQRIPNKRQLPDYFTVIQTPIAFSTIRGKIMKKQYSGFTEFVRDVAQICHNAQVYNRPSAPIFGAAERLRQVFKDELKKLVDKGTVPAAETELPYLGDLPPAEDSPEPDAEEEEEDEDEEEEDEEEDDSEEEGARRRGRRRGRPSIVKRVTDDGAKEEEEYKKRGRPPKVLTPMEARIHAVLKGLRKFKNDDGELRILAFEKLPDKAMNTEYYQTITNPIALDNIKKKAKRKKYHSVDQVLKDIELMFENAKHYNEEGSEVYEDAVELQSQARLLAQQEKARSDDEFRDEDGKLPLPEIQYNGQIWKVGDWVHIRNPNDLTKPIVAQIYRTWQDRSGQKWINACWYYRPEQTVHRFEKHFFENEVAKTGQYRDHQIEEVVDRCFVMFVTRFNKGRPRGFPPDKEVYVCEARYNEEKCRFNKIKTWASCVPDEVREKDYEMDLFEVARKLKKVPSPIKHLLQEDAKETDELPKPTWGHANAPPIIGAVHRRPRESNESPPPEPTPSPPPAPALDLHPEPVRRPSTLQATRDTPSDMSVNHPTQYSNAAVPGPSASPVPYGSHFVPQYSSASPVATAPVPHQTPVPVPHVPHQNQQQPQVQIRPMHFQQGYPPNYQQGYPQSPAPPAAQHHQMHQMSNPLAANFDHHHRMQMPTRTPMAPTPGNAMASANAYNLPRPIEVYTLGDQINDAIPEEVRRQYHTDDNGKVLFFTAPPLDRPHKGISHESYGLGHSLHYLAGRKEWLAERDRKRKERDELRSHDQEKRVAIEVKEKKQEQKKLVDEASDSMAAWFKDYDEESKRLRSEMDLDQWQEAMERPTA